LLSRKDKKMTYYGGDVPTGMPFESDHMVHRRHCEECANDQCYTRIYVNDKIPDAAFLCYGCASDYVEKRGYRELVLPILKSGDISISQVPSSSPPSVTNISALNSREQQQQ